MATQGKRIMSSIQEEEPSGVQKTPGAGTQGPKTGGGHECKLDQNSKSTKSKADYRRNKDLVPTLNGYIDLQLEDL